MKALVVFYSRTGTTKKFGQFLAKELGAEIEELIDLTNRKGPIGWLGGGRDAATKKETQITQTHFNPKDFDVVLLGSPVWAGTIAPALRTYLNKNKGNFKRVAFFGTYGGSAGSLFTEFEGLSKKPIGCVGFKTADVVKNAFEEKTKEFCKNISKI